MSTTYRFFGRGAAKNAVKKIIFYKTKTIDLISRFVYN